MRGDGDDTRLTAGLSSESAVLTRHTYAGAVQPTVVGRFAPCNDTLFPCTKRLINWSGHGLGFNSLGTTQIPSGFSTSQIEV